MQIDASPDSAKGKQTFHYSIIPECLVRDAGASDEAVRFYAFLHTLAKKKLFQENGQWRYPQVSVSQKSMVLTSGMSKSKIKRAQRQLVDLGWIKVARRQGRATNVITLYPRRKDDGAPEAS